MRLPSYPVRFAHLAALWGFGASQPVFSMLQGNPEFLVVRGSSRADVVVFALLLAFAPPLIVVLVEAVVAAGWKLLAGALHIAAIWAFAFLAALQVVRLLEPDGGAALLVPVLPGALIAFAYLRWDAWRSVLSLSFVLPLIGVAYFVATVPLATDDRPAADVRVSSQTPIVLVVFDEFPVSSLLRANGSLDEDRYPNFGRLAAESVWYPRATSVHAASTYAVPSILTGQLPKRGALPTLKDHPRNLFTLLGRRYSIRAFEQATRLCPTRFCPRTRPDVPTVDRQRGLLYDSYVAYLHRVLPGSLRGRLPTIGQRWGGFGDPDEVDVRELVLGALDTTVVDPAFAQARGSRAVQFADFLRSLAGRQPRRSLYFEHVMLPHSPWEYLPSGRSYGSDVPVEGMDESWLRWRPSKLLVDQGLQRHLLQVGYVDRLVGELIRGLKDARLYEQALVIVTADHGASFKAGGYRREVDRRSFADIAAIPLFVKYPGQRRGRVDARDAQTIDILPTIADVIGVAAPWQFDGRSLRGSPVTRRVDIAGNSTERQTADPDEVSRGVRATVKRNVGLFGEGKDSLYRLGPYPTLLGRSVTRLESHVTGVATVRIAEEELYADVRPETGFVPTRVTGSVEGVSRGERAALAIGVNGRIAATTWTFSHGGRTLFTALIPEDALRRGANTLEVLRVEQREGTPRLDRAPG